MTTSAYNLGNAGLVSKILRTKDLMRLAGVVFPVLGWETVLFTFSRSSGEPPSLKVGSEGLGERGCIVPIWRSEFSQSRLFVTGMK